MGSRQLNRLTNKAIAATTQPGMVCDGGGLYLQVSRSGSKAWVFRFRDPATGKLRDMGLGPLHSIGLAEARTKAAEQRKARLAGLDPIKARQEEIQRRQLEAAKAITFSQCAAAYIESHKAGWRNAKHTEQWTKTLQTYAAPIFGALPVQDVDAGLVLQVLESIWATKTETATRLRGRIENILDWAHARGYRSGENPARWKGHLNQLLPTLSKKKRVVHYKAMPFEQVGAFVGRLQTLAGSAARCLEFTILTACRTTEATNARPAEFDLEKGIWTIPGNRMKAGKEHRIPLSPRALEIVRDMPAHGEDWIFLSTHQGKPISNMAMLKLLERMKVDVTVHGFRSSFRDWAAECTAFSHEVCEMALAHTIQNSAEAAYRRGDLFEKRSALMAAWAMFLNPARSIIPLKQAA